MGILPLLEVDHIRISVLCLGDQEICTDSTHQITSEVDPQHISQANNCGRGKPVEEESRENGTEFSNCGGEAVREAPDPGWEDFRGNDKSRRVGSEVKEELPYRLASSLF